MGQPPYPPGPDPYGQPGDPYAQGGSYDPYAQGGDPYGQQPYHQQAAPEVHKYPGGGAQYAAMPAPYQAPIAQPSNGMATAALILGLVGVILCGLTSIPAIFCGHIAQSQIKRTGEAGSGMAVAGLVLGYVLTLAWLIYWVVVVGIMGLALWGANDPTYNY